MKELKSILSLSLIVTVLALAFAPLVEAGQYEDCINKASSDYRACQSATLEAMVAGMIAGGLSGGPIGALIGAGGVGAISSYRCDLLFQTALTFCERYANEFDWN